MSEYECFVCNYKSKTDKAMREHIKTNHRDISLCKNCGHPVITIDIGSQFGNLITQASGVPAVNSCLHYKPKLDDNSTKELLGVMERIKPAADNRPFIPQKSIHADVKCSHCGCKKPAKSA